MGVVTPAVIDGLTQGFLLPRYDNPVKTPPFHWSAWDLCCSDDRYVAIAAPRGHAKCLGGDTLVSLADGTRRRIADIAVGDRVVTYADGSLTTSRVTEKWASGVKPCVAIRTRSGRELRATVEHRLLTFDGWRAVADLGAGDYLASPRRLPLVETEDRLDEEVRLIAYIIAEGGLTGRSCNFTNFDAAIVRDMKWCCRKLGFKFRLSPRSGHYSLRGARPYFREQGLGGHSALTKRLQSWVFRLPERQKWQFIAALWDTDGWVASEAGKTGLTLANEALIDDVRELLLQLGIMTTKIVRPNECAGAWCIQIDNGCLRRFSENIPLLVKGGKLRALHDRHRYSLTDVYPNRIKKARRNVERDFREHGIRVDNRYEITRGKLARMIALEPLPEWEAAERADVFWDRIESITPVAPEETYDIEVWGTHSFVANGIVSHNSSAITHAYTLTMLLLRQRDFALIVSDTETQAIEFLGDIKTELLENAGLRETFGIKKLLKDTENNVICRMDDGHTFRVLAKGSEQKVRGLKWKGKRPNLIVGDDLENDESVANPDRREKFRKWVFNALLPCGSDDCLYRFAGTILHMDSWLNRVLEDPKWATARFRAHNADFSEILWPEKFPRERLESIRQLYANQGDLSGYSQEYLNNPIDEGNAFFRKQDFIPMDTVDRAANKTYVAAADFAISESERADFTVIMVAGIDENGVIHVVDVRRGRWDSLEIIDELFSVQKRYDIQLFTFETEKIDKALGPFINARMITSGTYLNIHKTTPSKSKLLRGRSISAKMKSGAVRFDTEADWYPALESELMAMTNAGSKGRNDDSFDAFAYIGMTIEQYRQAESVEEVQEYDYWHAVDEAQMDSRSVVTGY